MIRYFLALLFLFTGYFLQAQTTTAPATSATDADVKIQKNRKWRRLQGQAHATEHKGEAVPKQKVYNTSGVSHQGRVKKKGNPSARKERSKRAYSRKKKAEQD